MSNLIINCPHCDRSTPVELGKRVTTKQRCKHCGLIVGESDIVVGGRQRVVRKKVTVAGKEFGGEDTLGGSGNREGEERSAPSRVRVSHVIAMLLICAIGLGGVGYLLITHYVKRQAINRLNKDGFRRTEEINKRNAADEFDNDRKAGKLADSTVVSVETIQLAVDRMKLIKACKTPEELLQYVRNPDKDSDPTKIRDRLFDYYKSGRGELPIGDSLVTTGDIRIDYDEELRIAIFYATDQHGQPRWVVFRETDDGPKLDWESFVAYGEQDVFEFLDKKTQQPTEFRVLAMVDDYFNFQYSDFTEYTCVRLFDPGESFIFYGYVKKDTPLGRRIRLEVPPKRISMDGIASTEGGQATGIDGIDAVELGSPGLAKPRSLVTVKVQFPKDLQGANQVEITELIRRSWYVPGNDEDCTAEEKAERGS